MRTISTEKTAAANSTFAIGGVSCSADGLVVAESFVHRIKFSGKNPAHRKSANRWAKCPKAFAQQAGTSPNSRFAQLDNGAKRPLVGGNAKKKSEKIEKYQLKIAECYLIE